MNMEYLVRGNNIEVKLNDEFNLKHTFECGQCFRWNENADGSYTGTVGKNECHISKSNDIIIIQNCSESTFLNVWKNYFDLDTDYNKIRDEIIKLCPALECAVQSIDGIRILKQDPWEALCSFIISQNNNIPRIKGIISRLCESFGEPCGNSRTFPSAEKTALLSEQELAPLRAGFRAKYIIDAARKVSDKTVDLNKMYSAPIEECRTELMFIKGVGAKVAECTLLYGLHRLEAFPIDTWMKKALSTLFSGVSPESLGQYAGVAQQYIFHYTRNL